MKALLFLPLLPCLLIGCQSDGPPPGIDTNLGLLSQYNFRGVPQNDEGVFQADTTVTMATENDGTIGFTAWGNMDLKNDTGDAVFPDGNGGDFSEIDLTAFCSRRVGDHVFSIGVINYNFPNGVGDSTNEIYAGVEAEHFGITSSVTAYFDFDEVEGIYVSGALSRGHEINSKFSAELGVSIAYSDNDHSAVYYGANASGLADLVATGSLAYAYDENTTFSFTVSASTLIDDDLDDAVDAAGIDSDNVWAGLGVGWSF